MFTPLIITLAVTLPIIGVGAWVVHEHGDFVSRLISVRRVGFTIASLACGTPCTLLVLFVLFVEMGGTRNYDAIGIVMAIGYYYVFALPLAVLALVFAFFAKRYRAICFANATVYPLLGLYAFW